MASTITDSLKIQDDEGTYRTATSEEIIYAATVVINRRFRRGKSLTSTKDAQDFLRIHLAHLEHEVFAVVWLDTRHRVIKFEEMFRGTIDGASVPPREVVKSALQHNAAACILAHNHPSGDATPSQSDRDLTEKLKDALALLDIRILDHIVVSRVCFSFAEAGML